MSSVKLLVSNKVVPTRLVDLCNLESRQREVVGEENERVLVVVRGATNPTQQVRIILARIKPAQVDRWIAAQTGGAIHGTAGANARLARVAAADAVADQGPARLSLLLFIGSTLGCGRRLCWSEWRICDRATFDQSNLHSIRIVNIQHALARFCPGDGQRSVVVHVGRAPRKGRLH